MSGLVTGISAHRHQPVAESGVEAVEDPTINGIWHPARRLGVELLTKLRMMVGEIVIGAGNDGVKQLGVVASRDDDSQCPASQRRHLDGVCGAGEFGDEHPLDILIAECLGYRDNQTGGVTGEPRGIGLISQPGGHAGNEAGGADAVGKNISVEEVLLHKLAESGGELVLPLNDQRCVRYRQAKGTAKESGHREPICNTTDHGRLGASLHVAKKGPVDAGHSDDGEQNRYPCEECSSPPPRSGQAPRPQLRRFALDRGYRCRGHRRGRSHLAGPASRSAGRESGAASGE